MAEHPNRRAVLAAAAAVAGAAALPRGAASAGADNAYRTATELVAALAGSTVSSRELVDAAIARIEALDGRLNAVVVRDFDRAREAAAEADAAIARGERRPLLGLPMTVKEQFNVAGLPTTWGEPKFRGWKPAEDALAVARLKSAGAVILGKTNVPLQLNDWQSYNDVYGTTNNPWDVARTPGGSSGGAAAALAAGFVPLEFGSDIGGSLRVPAHFCGVFSHKPSLDLVPQRGSGPPQTPATPGRGDMAVIGPMARNAEDLLLELSVVAGPDPHLDGIGYRLALPPARHDALRDYRVLVLTEHKLCPVSASVQGALERLADRLDKAGCTVKRRVPGLPDLARTASLYVELLVAFFAADLFGDMRQEVERIVKTLPAEDRSLRASRLRGLVIDHPAWIRSSRMRGGLRQAWQEVFRDVDVILCPPAPTPAFPHDHTPQRNRQLDIDGTKIVYDDQLVWAAMATLFGFPATVAPLERTPEGLPVGVQIMGGFLEDHTTLNFARLIEREFGGFVVPPGY